MFRIAALNESGSEDGSDNDQQIRESTKEAKEAEAYALYNKALDYLRQGEADDADDVFRELIDHDFLQEAWEALEEKGSEAIHPGLQLLYSIEKNLAAMATQRKDYRSAMEAYLEAVKIDNSEVSVWFKMGTTALKLEDFQLAKVVFIEGLECNPRHWPCLDHLIPILYSLDNYLECLYYVSKAFELELHYDKGHAFRNKIYQEQPSLKWDTENFFKHCDPEIHKIQINPKDAKEYIEEALWMRQRRQELARPPEPERLEFPAKLNGYRWKCVGEVLIEMYDRAYTSTPPISMGLTVTIPDYTNVPSREEESGEDSLITTATEAANTDITDPPESQSETTANKNETAKGSESVEVMDTEEQIKPTDSVIEKPKDNSDPSVILPRSEVESSKADKPFTTYTDQDSVNPESQMDVDKDKPSDHTAEMSQGASAEESDSLLEAVNTAHSLIDSLSPAKAPEILNAESLKPNKNNNPLLSLDMPIVQSASSNNTPVKNVGDSTPDSQTVVPSIAKSGSYGFTVSNILSPECRNTESVSLKQQSAASEPVHIVGEPTVSVLAASPPSGIVYTIPEGSKAAKTDMAVAHGSMTASPVSCKAVVTECSTPDLAVPSVTGSAASSSSPFLISNILSTSTAASSPHTSTHPGLSIPVPGNASYNLNTLSGSNQCILISSASTSSSVSPLVSSITHAPPDFEIQGRSDHGYAKNSSSQPQIISTQFGGGDAGIVSMATGHSHFKRVLTYGSGNIPVIQSLHSSFDAMLESGSRSVSCMDMDDRSPGGRKGQKRRRISMATEEIMMYGKRRSARVRNTGRKKEEETVNFTDLLLEMIPSTLKIVQEEEDIAMETDRKESGADTTSKTSSTDGEAASQEPDLPAYQQWDEAAEVRVYLGTSRGNNAGLVSLMSSYLLELAKRCRVKWYEGLAEVYVTVFNKVRKHLYMPNVFDHSESHEDFQELSQMCLVWEELVLDRWLVTRAKVAAGSPVLSPRGQAVAALSDEDVPAFFEEDLMFLTVLCSDSDRLGSLWIDHSIRVYWMQARYYVLRGKLEEALGCFERTKEYLEYAKEEMGIQQVFIPNSKVENRVSIALVGSQFEQLQKNQSVAETERLYENREFDKVVDILLQTFAQSQSKAIKVTTDPTERQAQLMLLQEALLETKDFQKCLVWGEESLNEAYQSYRASSKSEERAEWVRTMVQIFLNLQRVLEKEPQVIKTLPSVKLVRLAQTLIQVIDTNMSQPEAVQTMAVDTVLPWILLYMLIKHEEDKAEGSRAKDQDNKDDPDDAMASSHMLLNIGHDYLGSRCWCTKSDGALLLFIMRVLKREMDSETGTGSESRFLEEYQQGFEQCVYCLYGHPNRRAKAKHLQDHNVTGITLEWEQAVDVFDYFKPKTVPEFDGYQSEKISAEMEVLLKRIILLIPESSKSMGVPIEEIQSYIEGSNTTLPAVTEGRQVTLPVVNEIYYLLGDYYLKNKEALKAIKFYIQDVCVNPSRLDSWAGMALARMSQLESRLTSTELKMDTPIYKKSIAALRCFKRAVEIDDSNGKLWIEYGTLAYQLHSHASRQLKWKKWFAMDEEMVSIATESRREMLATALECYRMASDCESDAHDEEWLHNYMRGKCLEKMRRPLTEVVPYYFRALESVHEEGAKYPKKIVYAYTTPHLAVESLEMFYRIHVVILKLLLKQAPDSEQIDYQAIIGYINEAADCPFVKRVEKGHEGKYERESASSADENSSSDFASPAVKIDGQNSKTDHTYFREKNNFGTPVQGRHGNQSLDKSIELSSPAGKSNVGMETVSVVKTLELHSEDQRSREDVTLTATECPKLASPARTSGETTLRHTQPDVDEKTQPAIEESSEDDEVNKKSSGSSVVKEDEDSKARNTETVVKNVLSHISDLIEKDITEASDKKVSEAVKQETDGGIGESNIPMEVDSHKPQTEALDGNDKSSPEGEQKTSADEPRDVKVGEDVEELMKKPRAELHRYLVDRCRKALELCAQRFPTHYKAHYRLASLYLHSPYHKDLGKAHDILLGVPKWQQHPHMPCQGLFWERKSTKFFQGIWKIPIDEIDRAGSFPSHLNRCIELILNVLKEEHDSQTLHLVHLQLNRQPEPGKKYLRDAEKKYYALLSHRYTLDAIEMQTEVMRKMADVDVRLKFLMTVYKIWEHGVHKLNKHVERTNRLLAESYRVVKRMLETLPHNMLLDQAIRFCKHQQNQKTVARSEKSQDSKSQGPDILATKDGKSVGQAEGEMPTSAASMPKLLSLANIMKNQANYSMLKANQASPTNPADTAARTLARAVGKESGEAGNVDSVQEFEVIELSDSSEVDSPAKPRSEETKAGTTDSGIKAPTVKIKMGLLQAVKRLKPTDGSKSDSDRATGKDVADESESEAPVPTCSEDEDESAEGSSSSSSSSSTSSSDSSSSDDDSDESDEDDDNDDEDNADDEEESGADNDSSDSSDDNDAKSTATKKTPEPVRKQIPVKLKVKPKPVDVSDDEKESSDGSDEIDLISSDNEGKDDDKDEDYQASDDEEFDDVILIREELYQKGRAVIPSPPHKNATSDMEVLVASVPDIDPLISSMMTSEADHDPDTASTAAPVPVGLPIPTRRMSSTGSSVMIIDSD